VPFKNRFGHVLADLLNLAGIAAVRLQKQRERLHPLVIAALDHEHPAALVQVGEHRDVVMPTPRTGLIDPDPLNALEVLRLDRPIDVVMHDPPDPHVRLADQAGEGRDGISPTIAITNASNNSVNPDRGRAHGTATSRTLCSGHSTRGTRAVRYA
jgi:hypothetical protein